jgi:hypothetical protein
MWTEPDDDSAPFLAGLRGAPMWEQEMIWHDAHTFPGWVPAAVRDGCALEFRRASRRLTIVQAHFGRFERVLGVDLLYYRHETENFVLVQYKRFSRELDRWVYRPASDDSLPTELERMDRVTAVASSENDAKDFRIAPAPCFIKLCRPTYFHPSNTSLITGMYLPLAYWKYLCADAKHRPVIEYDSIDRWMDNDLFTSLVADSWIGSSGTSTQAISRLVADAFDGGRSVVLAYEEGQGRKRRGRYGRG